ncbi:MAG: hypothetical protein NT096_00065 [Proteobacteria bacterium]|nr:hypothetical protein [Pseudomonadota bacterium]
MRTYIKIPIKIITPKIAQNKQDSIFYAGKVIAEVKARNRTYVLTTAGEYKFSLKENEGSISFDSLDLARAWTQGRLPGPTHHRLPRNFTDAKIKALGDKDLVSNWGWFGVNVWEQRPNIPGLPQGKDQCLIEPCEVWSDYDEAMNAFIEYVEKEITRENRN